MTLLLAIWHRMPDAPAQWGQAVSDPSRIPRRSVAGMLGASAGVRTTRSAAASWLLFDSARIAYTVAPRRTLRGRNWLPLADALLRTAVFDERPHRRPGVHLHARPDSWHGFQGTVFSHAMEITWHRPFFCPSYWLFARRLGRKRRDSLCTPVLSRSACLPMVWLLLVDGTA